MAAVKTGQNANFISYAQLCEDVVLYRALEHVERGFYIDVGAYDSTIASTTKAFYDRGWRGINIEPVESRYCKLADERPQDINLRVAAGNFQGSLRFFEVLDTGLSTASLEFSRNHERAGYKVKETQVQVTTLNAICNEYQAEVVHFLKIDVEGLEKEVLEGIDLSSIRPWIIIAEATVPLSFAETYNCWEFILTDNRYTFARTDGLNRFYCSNEHSELIPLLQEPLETFIFTRTTLK